MTKQKMVSELKSAQWIGEEGNMATISSSALGAWRKFKKEILEVGGDIEGLGIEQVQIGWAYLCTEKTKKENEDMGEDWEDASWYVSYKLAKIDGVKGVKVWVLNF